MKGYQPPRKLEPGICFICLESCKHDAFCHYPCAIAFSEEKNKRTEEARIIAKEKEKTQ